MAAMWALAMEYIKVLMLELPGPIWVGSLRAYSKVVVHPKTLMCLGRCTRTLWNAGGGERGFTNNRWRPTWNKVLGDEVGGVTDMVMDPEMRMYFMLLHGNATEQ